MLDCQQLTLTLVTAAPQGPAQVPNLTQGSKEEEKVIKDYSKITMFQTL